MALTFNRPNMGNDPEIFVMRQERLIPSEKFLDQTNTVKVDNAAIEFQPGPNTCLQSQNHSIAINLKIIRDQLISKKMEDVIISLRPTETLEREDIFKCPSVCLFGCQPSLVFDGTHLRRSVPIADPMVVRHRSVGYHVHVGSPTPECYKNTIYNGQPERIVANTLHTTEGRVRLVQLCDLMVGLPAVMLERDERVPIRRKTLGYGQAGEFREQPHGFEYRTLGAWPLKDPMWAWWANACVRDCLQFITWDQDLALKQNINMIKVADVINEGNLAGAVEIWHQVKKNLQPIIDWAEKETGNIVPMDDSHPLFSRNLLRMFDFLVMKKDVSRRQFDFENWLKIYKPQSNSAGEHRAFYFGFNNGAKLEVKAYGNEWDEFENAWSLDKDIISKQLLA
jgi:hypothetical protein